MIDDTLQPGVQPGFIDRASDAVTETSRAGAQVASVLRAGVDHLSGVVNDARRPGQPLDVVSKVARDAPLSALFVAFLLGVAFARRR